MLSLVPAAYHAQIAGLEFPYAAARPGTVLDYPTILEPSILGKANMNTLLVQYYSENQ